MHSINYNWGRLWTIFLTWQSICQDSFEGQGAGLQGWDDDVASKRASPWKEARPRQSWYFGQPRWVYLHRWRWSSRWSVGANPDEPSIHWLLSRSPIWPRPVHLGQAEIKRHHLHIGEHLWLPRCLHQSIQVHARREASPKSSSWICHGTPKPRAHETALRRTEPAWMRSHAQRHQGLGENQQRSSKVAMEQIATCWSREYGLVQIVC